MSYRELLINQSKWIIWLIYNSSICDLWFKSVGIWGGIVNPIYGCRVRMTPGVNPIYPGLERSCPRDSKNVSYVDIGLA